MFVRCLPFTSTCSCLPMLHAHLCFRRWRARGEDRLKLPPRAHDLGVLDERYQRKQHSGRAAAGKTLLQSCHRGSRIAYTDRGPPNHEQCIAAHRRKSGKATAGRERGERRRRGRVHDERAAGRHAQQQAGTGGRMADDGGWMGQGTNKRAPSFKLGITGLLLIGDRCSAL